jgi:nucleoside 2-deoxyribosyltransferase
LKKVFISGPIQGMETQQEYRQTITKICARLGFEVIDPWLREKILYRKEEPCWWDNVPAEGFVQRDLDDVDICDLMVVYLPKISAGACMELFYAKRKGKKIVVVSPLPCISPWIVVHSDKIVENLDQLEDAIKEILTQSD